jgi:hypothetical protein
MPRLVSCLCLAAFVLFLRGAAGAADEVILAKGGKSEFAIVLPAKAGPTERFAASELKRYVKQMSGASLPVVTSRPGNRKPIRVGLRDALREQGLALPPPAKGYDGHALAVRPEGVVIAGDNPRGVLYGVYAFLERLGCRWFYPQHDPKDEEVVPRRAALALPPFESAVASPFWYRSTMLHAYGKEAQHMALREVDWMAKARYNLVDYPPIWADGKGKLRHGRPRGDAAEVLKAIRTRGLMTYGIGHGFRYFLPTETYFEKHPEWFGLRNGRRVHQGARGAQFCWSNPEAVKTFVDNVAAWLRSGPALDVLKISAEDGPAACACDRCKTLNPADWYQRIQNQIVARASKIRPKLVMIGASGYPPQILPPKETELDPRLHLMWAQWGRNQSVPFNDPSYPAANVNQWLAAAPNRLGMTLYYSGLMTSPPVPPPYCRTFTGDRSFMVARGVEGFHLIQFPSGVWWTTGFNNYLLGQGGYDASLDPYAALADYCDDYFGPAAGPMKDYYRALADDVPLSYHVSRGSPAGPGELAADRAKLDELRARLESAQRLVSGKQVYAYRVSKALAVHGYLESLQSSREHRALLAAAAEARKTGGETPSAEDIACTLEEEAALVAEDQKRLGTMPPGTFDGLMEWLTRRAARFQPLREALVKEPG